MPRTDVYGVKKVATPPEWLELSISRILRDPPRSAQLAGEIPASYHFRDVIEYAQTLRYAIVKDFQIERDAVDAFNKNTAPFSAWVIKDQGPSDGFLLRIEIRDEDSLGTFGRPKFQDWLQPKVGDWCYFLFNNDGKQESFLHGCGFRMEVERSPDIVKMPHGWSFTLEFRVPVPLRSTNECLRRYLRYLADKFPDSLQKPKDSDLKIEIKVELKLGWMTLAAELASIERLMEISAPGQSPLHLPLLDSSLPDLSRLDLSPSDSRGKVFEYLVRFNPAGEYTNLGEVFPSIWDLDKIIDVNTREKLQHMFTQLEADTSQKEAYDSLRHIPSGLFLAPGCFGSGKSFFCMYVAARAQAGLEPAKVLYLTGVNKACDHAVKQMTGIYKDLGMKKKAIRMRQFPREMTDSEFGRQCDERDTDERKEERALADSDPWHRRSPDWRRTFIEEWRRSRLPNQPSSIMQQAAEDFLLTTLDDAAFVHYQQNTSEWEVITKALDSLTKSSEERTSTDWENIDNLRPELASLYSQLASTSDFLSMTPCAAFSYCHLIFKENGGPDIVIIDEAAFLREPSALIALAAYTPTVWMMVGDYRQSSPYSNDSKLKAQLHLSLLERACANDIQSPRLLTNHRSHGDLHLLPSSLFYDGQIMPGQQTFPESAYHLRRKLNNIAFDSGSELKLKIPRLLVSGDKLGKGRYDNPAHRTWVMKKALEFLEDKEFTHVHSATPGTILIVTPYKVAYSKYKIDIQQLPKQYHSRIRAGTTALAQGEEADLVFVDMVVNSATPFNAEPKRLCSLLTRARQAEIIVMSPSICERRSFRSRIDSSKEEICDPKILRELWEQCENEEHGAVISLHNH